MNKTSVLREGSRVNKGEGCGKTINYFCHSASFWLPDFKIDKTFLCINFVKKKKKPTRNIFFTYISEENPKYQPVTTYNELRIPKCCTGISIISHVVSHYPEVYGQKTGYHHIPSVMIENKCDIPIIILIQKRVLKFIEQYPAGQDWGRDFSGSGIISLLNMASSRTLSL